MKNFLFAVLFMVSLSALAQQEFYYPQVNYGHWPIYWNRYEMEPTILKQHITKIVGYAESPAKGNKGPKKILQNEVSFNEKGVPVATLTYRKSGKPSANWKIVFNGRDFSEMEYSASNVLKKTSSYKFDSDSNLISYELLMGPENKLKRRLLTTYDGPNHQMLERKLYKSGEKLVTRWRYEYDGRKILKTTVWNGKGNVKHVWNHDCLPEGIEAGKESKDTTTVCRKFETDAAGDLIQVTRTIDEKGEYVMNRTVYHPDTTLKAYFTFDYKARLVWAYYPNNKYSNSSDSYHYNKGKEYQHYHSEYKDGLRVKSTTTFRKKPGHTTNMYYDESGCMVKTELWSDKNNTLLKTHYFEFTKAL